MSWSRLKRIDNPKPRPPNVNSANPDRNSRRVTTNPKSSADAALVQRFPIFGFWPNCESIGQIVNTILSRRRAVREGVGLVVTPNIDHIAKLRQSAAFRQAYANAAMVLCDGFPVHYYARLRGHPVNRITGCELVKRLLVKAELSDSPSPIFCRG